MVSGLIAERGERQMSLVRAAVTPPPQRSGERIVQKTKDNAAVKNAERRTGGTAAASASRFKKRVLDHEQPGRLI